MMAYLLGDPTPWHWFIFGIVMIVVEMLAPGAVFLWLGLAAIAVGLVFAVLPDIPWQYQLLLFGILSPLSIFAGRRFASKRLAASDHPGLNRRGAEYIGRTYRLGQPLENGAGVLVIDDTRWTISGADAPAGTMVKVVGMDGAILRVEPLHS